MTDTTTTPSVFAALQAARLEIGPVAKDRKNSSPGANYNFRGIDDVVNACSAILNRHGLVLVSHKVREAVMGQLVYGNKETKAQTYRMVRTWRLYGPAGDHITFETAGAAFDSGDKAVTKAMTYSWRTAIIELLMLPTDSPDPDAFTYDVNQDQFDRTTGEVLPQPPTPMEVAGERLGWDRGRLSDVLGQVGWTQQAFPHSDDHATWRRVVEFLDQPPVPAYQPTAEDVQQARHDSNEQRAVEDQQ